MGSGDPSQRADAAHTRLQVGSSMSRYQEPRQEKALELRFQEVTAWEQAWLVRGVGGVTESGWEAGQGLWAPVGGPYMLRNGGRPRNL